MGGAWLPVALCTPDATRCLPHRSEERLMSNASLQPLATLLTTCIGRRDDYALQRASGLYARAGQPLTRDLLRAHLQGRLTLGTYVIDEQGCCRFAVYDADSQDGLLLLLALQQRLATAGMASCLEASRRGAHLWVFLARPTPAGVVRGWLHPYTPAGVEFYPKQETASPERPGSLIRVPLGIHRRCGRRYPFVEVRDGALAPVARTVGETLSWLATVPRLWLPGSLPASGYLVPAAIPAQKKFSSLAASMTRPAPTETIRDWCLSQDPLTVIGGYVELDARGMGCCPFGWHHAAGRDRHPSLWVHPLRRGELACWWCHTWQRGGSLFDFLRLYHGLSARQLWGRIRAGERF